MLRKRNYSFFRKPSKKYDILLVLTKMKINNREIAGTESIRFLGFLLGKKLSLKPHIKYIENKI